MNNKINNKIRVCRHKIIIQLTPSQASKLFLTLLRLNFKNCGQQKVSLKPGPYFHNPTMFVFVLHIYRNINVNRKREGRNDISEILCKDYYLLMLGLSLNTNVFWEHLIFEFYSQFRVN